MRPRSLRYGLGLSGIRCLNVIGYLPGKLCDLARVQHEKFYMHFTMLGFAPNMISCISVTTYFYVYLVGDLTWTMLLGKLDSTPTSYLHQQSPTTTSTSRERSTTCRRIQRLHHKTSTCVTCYIDYSNTWRHVGD
jgi:hypothetical protein